MTLTAEDLPLPEWAEKRSDGNYMEPGAQLATRDGRRIGNAYVDRIEQSEKGASIAVVVTDMGSTLHLNERELESEF